MSLLLTFALRNWRWIAGVVLALALVAFYQSRMSVARKQGRAEVQANWDAEKVEQKAAAFAELQRALAAQKEIEDEARNRTEKAHADAAGARAAGDRLREQLAAVRRASAGAAVAGSGAATGDPIGVLADVLGRADERAGELAAYADAARIAGLACERSYDAVTPR